MNCLFIVVLLAFVKDAAANMPPTIYCPKSTDFPPVIIRAHQTKAKVEWEQSDVFAMDQEDGNVTTVLDPHSPHNGQQLGPGTYTIVYKATDSGGRVSQCSFAITVKRAQCPGLASPQYGRSTCLQGAVFGQICSVECSSGYEVLGANGVECLENGSYSDVLPVCSRVTSYKLICDNIKASPSSRFMHDVDTNFNTLKNRLIATGALNSFKTMERVESLCSDKNFTNHGSCIFLRRLKMFDLFKNDSGHNDMMYRRLLLLHPEIAKFCQDSAFTSKLYDEFPDIGRFDNTAYQTSFTNTMKGLVNTTNSQLRSEAILACDPQRTGANCLLKDAFDLIDRSLLFISHLNKVGHWNDVDLNNYFNALTFSSVLFKWNYLGLVSAVKPQANRDQQDVITNILQAIASYVDDGKDDKIRTVTALFPKYVTDKICNTGKMCLFWRVVDQTRVYLKSRQPSTSNGVPVRVLDPTLNKKDFLQQKQFERMLELMARQQNNLIEVANDLKDEFKKTINNRFSELKTYFKKIQSFNAAKARADLGIIQDIKDLSNSAIATARSVDKDMTYIMQNALVATATEVAGKTTKLAMVIAENCNPLKAITDFSASDIYDASSELANAVASVASAGALVASIHILKRQSTHISHGFAANDRFFAHMKTVMDSVNAEKKTEDFEDAKDAFLEEYASFAPSVKKSELAEMGSYFANVVDQACSLIEGTDTLNAALTKSIVGGRGTCWKTKVNIDKMMSMYESIYDQQFELVEVMVSNVQAQVALDAADGILTDYNQVSKAPSASDDVLQKLQQVAGMSYVSYRLMVIQVIRLYCDELEYKNGGNRPQICKDQSTDISTLLSYTLQPCRRKADYESVPARKRGYKDTAYMDVSALYEEQAITFKIPNSKWLYDHGWITRADRYSSIYLTGLEVYLPSDPILPRTITVQVITDGQNELKPGGTRYRIEPSKPLTFEYKLGHNMACMQGPTTDNPYNTCPTNKVAEICRLTEDLDLELYPSIYSQFRIQVTGYKGLTVPNESTRLNLKLGVRTCTYVPDAALHPFTRNSRYQGTARQSSSCCGADQYWSGTSCTDCPANSTAALNGYFCQRN